MAARIEARTVLHRVLTKVHRTSPHKPTGPAGARTPAGPSLWACRPSCLDVPAPTRNVASVTHLPGGEMGVYLGLN